MAQLHPLALFTGATKQDTSRSQKSMCFRTSTPHGQQTTAVTTPAMKPSVGPTTCNKIKVVSSMAADPRLFIVSCACVFQSLPATHASMELQSRALHRQGLSWLRKNTATGVRSAETAGVPWAQCCMP